MEYEIETRCQHLESEVRTERAFGALSYPIYLTSTFAHKGVGKSTGYDYSRLQNPTREQLEHVVASLEKGKRALAFSSGMATITAAMELFHPGDHILIEKDLYGGSVRLFQHINQKNGLEFTAVDFSVEDPLPYLKENTKAVFVETPSNPMMHVIDLEQLGKFTKEHDLLLIVDNTFLSPYFMNPIDFGADIVAHSGTKYLGGHHDLLAGFLVTAREDLAERLEFILKTTGGNLDSFDSWLALRGIKTLAVRMKQAEENTKKIAEFLLDQPAVTKVLYPGLKDHPGHDVIKRQSRGFGAVLTFEVDSVERAHYILNHLKIIQFAESLGGTESLITYPKTQTHADLSEEERLSVGITDRILRLSIGIENVEDLIKDLADVLTAEI